MDGPKDILCIKMDGFSRELDWLHHHQQFISKKEDNENDMAANTFLAVFIPAIGGAKSAKKLISTVLPFYTLYFP